jgi:hyperosmotically inducible protein
MKHFRKYLAMAALITAFSAASVVAQNYSGNNKSTKTLEQQIYKKLKGLPHYGVFDHIAFTVNGSTVTLNGKVASLGTKSGAASVVKRIPGVTSVVNNIEELSVGSFDNEIRRRTLRTLSNEGLYRYFAGNDPAVRIIVDNGHITLEGFVASRGDYNRMNIYANGIPGVFTVTNNLEVGARRGM